MKRRTMLTAACSAVLLALAWLGPAPDTWAAEDHYKAGVPKPTIPAGKKIRVVVLIPNGPDPYFQSKWYGYEDEAKRLGINFQLLDAGGYAFLDKQIRQLEDVVQTQRTARSRIARAARCTT